MTKANVAERVGMIAPIEEREPFIEPLIEIPQKVGMGWLRENPDIRDFDSTSLEIRPMLKQINAAQPPKALPPSVDLRAWCSPIENQLNIGSCTANAGVGLIEYMERRAFGNHLDASRLFLYKVTRNLLKWTGDTGAYLRTTMGAMSCFGVPPESYWPYTPTNFDIEPTAFCYAFAADFKALKYYRFDTPTSSPVDVLTQVRTSLNAGIPVMFGFTVYSSYTQANTTGKIPFPTKGDKVAGGHAVDAVGYNDSLKIKNTNTGGIETTGAFLIRNSWGTAWGDHGYGWLPYEYLLKGQAADWWALLSQAYVDTHQFGV